jgi:hypothetical protein
MPFDNPSAARPYMREGTAALAALVATRPARDVLVNIAAEIVHRDRPAARRLADEVAALLGASVPASEAAPVLAPSPEAPLSAPPAAPLPLGVQLAALPPAELLRTLAALPYAIRIEGLPGETLPRSRKAAARVLGAAPEAAAVVASHRAKIAARRASKAHASVTREENLAMRGVHNRARWLAENAAHEECGRAPDGQPLWPDVTGAAHRVEVPEGVALYVPISGKPKMGDRVQVSPAPRFWPGGTLPEGYADLGPIVPRIARKALPGSVDWNQAVTLANQHENGAAENDLRMAETRYQNAWAIFVSLASKAEYRTGKERMIRRRWVRDAWNARVALRKARARLAGIKAALAA